MNDSYGLIFPLFLHLSLLMLSEFSGSLEIYAFHLLVARSFPIDNNPWHASFMEGWVFLDHIIIALWPYIVAAVSELI